MGIEEFEKALDKVVWKDVYQIAKEIGSEPCSTRVVGRKAVCNWGIAESKRQLVNGCWRTFYRLKQEKDLKGEHN